MVQSHVIHARNGSQKCRVPLAEFKALNCPIGSPVRVFSSSGTFTCRLYPGHDLAKGTCIVEDTVKLYSRLHSQILVDPVLADHSSIVQLTPCSVTEVSVTVVVDTLESAKLLNQVKAASIVKTILAGKFFSQSSSISTNLCGIRQIHVLQTNPPTDNDAAAITSKTQVKVASTVTDGWCRAQQQVREALLGGISSVYSKLKESVSFPLRNPQVRLPRGVLLHGPTGCGKSSVVRQLCYESGFYLMPVTCADLGSSDPGGSEAKLRSVFEECLTNSTYNPVVLFLDEIDAICPKGATQTHTARLITCLVGLIDALPAEARLVLVAATSNLDALDPSLRRPGRLDREVFMSVPNGQERLEILQVLSRHLAIQSDSLAQVAEMTTGYVGADLHLLCRQVSDTAGTAATLKDWKAALARMRPSVMRQESFRIGEFRKATWDDVGGLEEAKVCIRRSVEWPLKHPEAFERLKVPRPKGVLVYGPPGCGKSLLVRAAATSCAASFLSISAAELFSPYVGDSEKMVTALFQRARLAVPAILFLDELDAMVGGRSRSANQGRTAQLGVVATLLQEMDGIASSQGVIVVGATNRPDKIDAALLRPGRFDSLVYIPNPDERARLSILKAVCKKMPLKGVDLALVASKTDLFSGADLEALAKEAALNALEKDLTAAEILQEDFDSALGQVPPSLTAHQLTFYERYASGRVE